MLECAEILALSSTSSLKPIPHAYEGIGETNGLPLTEMRFDACAQILRCHDLRFATMKQVLLDLASAVFENA